ncbi:MAG: phage head-tail joining protein [Desulfatirhabdiaceae bacterium]
MAYTEEDLTAVNTAITRLMSGERVVRITKGDQMVEYGQTGLPELRAYRAEIMAEINAASGRPRHYRVRTGKGL